MNKRAVGNIGEDIAVSYLLESGYEILARQFHSKVGEIDIVAEYNGVVVFIEVKLRSGLLWGTPAESVNYRKQSKIVKTAQYYLQKNGLEKKQSRFDVVEVLDNQEAMNINHIENAFTI